ncbi:MAG: tRNA lysidine(34) synthetase TilS [Pseudomonadota bacterium]
MAAPDVESVARFRADLTAALGADPTAFAPIGLAVSGGADSMAMLALTHAALPGVACAATVDHGLRPAAAQEAQMVARSCAKLGIRHETLRPIHAIAGASIQAQAREARYALLFDWARAWGVALLLTAHHADDQAETFLMRAARGSGVAGLAGVRRVRAGPVPVARPLLGWRRADLRALAQSAGLPFVDDPSNDDRAHDRTRFRTLLRDSDLLDPLAIAASAAHAAEADAALATVAALLWAERARVSPRGLDVLVTGLPREVLRRIARRGIAEVRVAHGIATPVFDDAANVEPLLDSLERGKGATQAGVAVRPLMDRWRFRPAPPRRSL